MKNKFIKQIKHTHEELKKAYFKDIEKWVDISNFIDHIFSSYSKTSNSLSKTLKINITYDLRDKNNTKLIISDNRNYFDINYVVDYVIKNKNFLYGDENQQSMSFNNLIEQENGEYQFISKNDYQEYSNKTIEENSYINIKNLSFGNGKNVRLFFKWPDKCEHYIDFNFLNKDPNFKFGLYKSEYNLISKDYGSKLVIENLYENRIPTNEDIDKIIIALGYLYESKINDGTMKISIKKLDDKNNEYYKITNTNLIQCFSLGSFFDNIKDKVKDVEEYKYKINKAIYELYETTDNKLLKILTKNILKNVDVFAFISFNLDKEENEEIYISDNFYNSRSLIGEIGSRCYFTLKLLDITSSNKQRYGFKSTHMLTDNFSKDKNTTQCFYTSYLNFTNEDTIHNTRLYAEFDFTKYEQENEQEFNFEWNIIWYDKLLKHLNQIYKDILPLFELLQKIENIEL